MLYFTVVETTCIAAQGCPSHLYRILTFVRYGDDQPSNGYSGRTCLQEALCVCKRSGSFFKVNINFIGSLRLFDGMVCVTMVTIFTGCPKFVLVYV